GFVTPPLPERSLEWRDEDKERLLQRARSADDLGRRWALDDIWRHHQRFGQPAVMEVVRANWNTSDRGTWQAAVRLMATLADEELRQLFSRAKTPRERLTVGFGTLDVREDDYAIYEVLLILD